MKPHMFIRTDMSHGIGTGHVMRCLALAQAAQDTGKQVTFALAQTSTTLDARLRQERVDIVHMHTEPGSIDDATQTISTATRLDANWVVVDGYHFGPDYQNRIKEAGLSLLLLDDNGTAADYKADFILNQNIHAHERLYSRRAPYTKLLLGTHFALLRREFKNWRGWSRETPEVARKILVTLGGSDPDNVTLKVIQALQNTLPKEAFEVVVVVGGANPLYDQLLATVNSSPHQIQLAIDVIDMPSLMARVDVAITAGGSTLWELAFMGLPALVITLADNQRQSALESDAFGSVINLGWHEHLSEWELAGALSELVSSMPVRTRMADQGRLLVDGKGAERVLMYMEGNRLRLREIIESDCRLIWEWANDALVRAMSFLTESIPWELHVKWFTARMNDANSLFLIAEDVDGQPVGQVRYDIIGVEARVSIAVDQKFRGKGYGTEILQLSAKRITEQRNVQLIHAYIKPANKASQRAFLKAGYKFNGMTIVHGCNAADYILEHRRINEPPYRN